MIINNTILTLNKNVEASEIILGIHFSNEKRFETVSLETKSLFEIAIKEISKINSF